ncbi:MAG: hypothetical protein LBJ17_05520 [Dysgonamonadaceae bacterium]|jgi:hypothetical protein|nr:hypothetical protein [Dysgonamonadaceae bacterium]
MKKILLTMTVLFTLSASCAFAQVTIGSLDDPQKFSILELVSTSGGLRLPQLDIDQRDALDFEGHADEARGLQIFNIDTKCIETWNGAEWIMQCDCGDHPCPPPHDEEDVPSAQPLWSDDEKWVGAFWRDNQTGERIIVSTGSEGVEWTAEIDDAENTGAWLNLDNNGGTDVNLWTDNPGDAENYQLPADRKTGVSGTGTILFRIGVFPSIDDRTTSSDYKYPDGSNGKPPRYATITLTVGSESYTLYCRQGEAADYVFNKTEEWLYSNGVKRTKAVKFSPYNLTYYHSNYFKTDTVVPAGVSAKYHGGSFIDYPSKAGSNFQWAGSAGEEGKEGKEGKEALAYHPVMVATLDQTFPDSVWSEVVDIQESCPDGWRRPNDGSTSGNQVAVNDDGDDDNIHVSEMRQSLYAVPQNGDIDKIEDLYIDTEIGYYNFAWGYYADGYFDRREVGVANSTTQENFKTAVSIYTKDAAYIGNLFFNKADKHSLFMPAAGFISISKGLSGSGGSGYYWSSSRSSSNGAWLMHLGKGGAVQTRFTYNYGLSVRCVEDEVEEEE